MEERGVLGQAGLGVQDLVEAGYAEARGVAPGPSVHVVAKGQDDLQDLLQPLAGTQLLGGFQYS